MSKTALLSVKILADARDAAKGLTDTASKLDKLEGHANKAAQGMSVASAGVIAFGKQAFDSASSLQQSTGAVEAVFKEQAAQIESLASQASQAVGLSKNEYQEMATVMGAQLKNMGVSSDELVGQTQGLIDKGADLAATFGGTTSDAVSALSALMRGEADPIERYGVSIKDADIKARMAADGTAELEGEQAKAARTAAIMALLNEQTADAMGSFAREADTAAGQQQRATAAWEDAKSKLGEFLLPIVAETAAKFSEWAQKLGEHPDALKIVGGAILGVTGALWGIVNGIKTYKAIVEAAKLAQVAWNFAMSANPIGLVIVALTALAAGLVIAYQKSETFRAIVDDGFQAAADAARWCEEAIKGIGDWLKRVADAAPTPGEAMEWAADVANQAWEKLGKPITNVKGWIIEVADAAPTPGEAMEWAAGVAKRAWETAAAPFEVLFDWLKLIMDQGTIAGDAISDRFETVKKVIRDLIDPIRNAIEWLDSMIDRVQSIPGQAAEWILGSAPDPEIVGVPSNSAILFASALPTLTAAAPRIPRRFAHTTHSAQSPEIHVHISDSVIGDEITLARTIRKALENTDGLYNRRPVGIV